MVLGSYFFSCGLNTLISAGHPQICKYLRLGFLSVHNSNEVDETDLLGILFKMYMAVLRTSPHIDSGKDE